MALHRSIDGPDGPGGGANPIERVAGDREVRPASRTRVLGEGTLACPRCDAPVAPGPDTLAPADPLSCPLCGEAGAVRDFLSLETPSRPARVVVTLVVPGLSVRVGRR